MAPTVLATPQPLRRSRQAHNFLHPVGAKEPSEHTLVGMLTISHETCLFATISMHMYCYNHDRLVKLVSDIDSQDRLLVHAFNSSLLLGTH